MKPYFYNPLYLLRNAAGIVWLVSTPFLNLAAFILTGFRQKIVFRLLRMEGAVLLWILNVKVRVDENLLALDPRSGKNFLFIANHQSMLDILVVYSLVPVPLSFIAKKELFWFPFLNIHLWLAGCVSIDRHSLRRSYRDIQTAVDLLKRKRSIFIFPEGTRQTEDHIGPFKPGFLKLAQEAGVDLVPIVMRGSGKVMIRGSFLVDPRESITVSLGRPLPVTGRDAVRQPDTVRQQFTEIYARLKK